jgi:hypothetical protein
VRGRGFHPDLLAPRGQSLAQFDAAHPGQRSTAQADRAGPIVYLPVVRRIFEDGLADPA